MEIRYPNNNGWRRREIDFKTLVNIIIMASLTDINLMTHFQSLSLFWFLMHFVFSLFQFCWSWSVRKQAEFSFESGKKSFSSNGRSLPILKILFIHWNSRRDTRLSISLSSFLEIFLYPFLAVTVNLKNSEDQLIEIFSFSEFAGWLTVHQIYAANTAILIGWDARTSNKLRSPNFSVVS